VQQKNPKVQIQNTNHIQHSVAAAATDTATAMGPRHVGHDRETVRGAPAQ